MGCLSLDFLDAGGMFAAVGVPYCTCMFDEGTDHGLVGELFDCGRGNFQVPSLEAEHSVCLGTDTANVPFPSDVNL